MKTFRIRVGGQAPDVEADCETSLFAAMARAGIVWPVSCRNGTCRTCIARLLEGQVRYDIPWPGLSAEEKLEGYCLPCIALPMSDVVIAQA
ncbi:MAG: ferredoxin [Betaproteobacteria bacterium HGW-Betaproteobacteria-9]|jgi:ferredoxin|nr:MAG: ferredoxin [Betaproteobacteria bacterium HGW-Betaproteobacteria-9]PKO78280.1 MAG: ferredoxin [Betaproteobacteria bacterium HGW-Betaproteobacteria-15]